ncbi:hypothetical protein BJ322DRAFT_1080740 [Thelephora terrestris]|uniref:Uncharacterized protein n=1 Tax=Thelephora terrestris TaxID=56493 RepID=A0A9P6H8P5_9AGAM|nr:hypothetical protein BJ322DRAFT_1080740 [Thelephora terrestris]
MSFPFCGCAALTTAFTIRWRTEIRNFPQREELKSSDLIDFCTQGLANSVNLQSFVWVRFGTLNSRILLAILGHLSLQELEINARNRGLFDDTILPQLTSVTRIKLLDPSLSVIDILPAWLKSLTNPLQHLSIVGSCQSWLTDELLEQISEDLSGLEELTLKDWNSVTHEGLVKALRHNKNGIKCLTIRDLSHLFDVPEFDRRCRLKPHLLSRLTSLTITIDRASAWKEAVSSLVTLSTLECLLLCGSPRITDTGAQMDDFVTTLVSAHGSRLREFSLHRVLISPQALGDVCVGIKGLRRLSIWIRFRHLNLIGDSLSKATKLNMLYVTPLRIRLGKLKLMSPTAEEAMRIANHCSPTLTKIKFVGQIWLKGRSSKWEKQGKRV